MEKNKGFENPRRTTYADHQSWGLILDQILQMGQPISFPGLSLSESVALACLASLCLLFWNFHNAFTINFILSTGTL